MEKRNVTSLRWSFFSCRVKQIIEGQAYINFKTSATLCLHQFVVFRRRDASQTERSDNRSSKCGSF